MLNIHFGTCSWKYDSWKGLVYPHFDKINHLEEYAKVFSSVEVVHSILSDSMTSVNFLTSSRVNIISLKAIDANLISWTIQETKNSINEFNKFLNDLYFAVKIP